VRTVLANLPSYTAAAASLQVAMAEADRDCVTELGLAAAATGSGPQPLRVPECADTVYAESADSAGVGVACAVIAGICNLLP
jgi:hypothetical protein